MKENQILEPAENLPGTQQDESQEQIDGSVSTQAHTDGSTPNIHADKSKGEHRRQIRTEHPQAGDG